MACLFWTIRKEFAPIGDPKVLYDRKSYRTSGDMISYSARSVVTGSIRTTRIVAGTATTSAVVNTSNEESGNTTTSLALTW